MKKMLNLFWDGDSDLKYASEQKDFHGGGSHCGGFVSQERKSYLTRIKLKGKLIWLDFG